jgi:hypothetical protein
MLVNRLPMGLPDKTINGDALVASIYPISLHLQNKIDAIRPFLFVLLFLFLFNTMLDVLKSIYTLI